jgi:uncharacterized membrane protein YgaE (UPF0421/DUF939 family)
MADTFDYYANSKSFICWALINMLGEAREAGRDAEEDFFEELKRRSNTFSEVEMSIKLNGLEVDASKFMQRIDTLIDTMVERKTQEKLEAIQEISEIEDELANVRHILKQRVNQLADKYDIGLYRED